MKYSIEWDFFIKDLYQQLERLQIETLKKKLPLTVYKIPHVSNKDLEKIKDINEHLLSFDNFIMADSGLLI